MRKLLFLAVMLIWAVQAQATITFVGRTQASNGAANSAISSISFPTGTVQGDFVILEIVSSLGAAFANGLPPGPITGWAQCSPTQTYAANGHTVTGISNSQNEASLVYYTTYINSMGSALTNPGGTTMGSPKAIMRSYHSSLGAAAPPIALDTCSVTPATVGKVSTSASTAGTSMTLTSQSATIANNEWFAGFYIQDAGTVTAPGGLSHVTADNTQWFTADGDLISATSGTVVSGLTATATSGNWLGTGVSFFEPSFPATVTEVPPISAPAGFKWMLSFDDEYGYINFQNWSGDEYLIPWGATQNTNTFNGIAIGATGMALTATVNQGNYGDLTGRVDEETVGKFYQRYGYFEWRMKLPTDAAGEGDGHYVTNWAVPVNKTGFPDSTGNPCTVTDPDTGNEEIDLTETQLATGSAMNSVVARIHDCNFNEYSQALPASSVGNLSSAFHNYGFYWAKDASLHGTFYLYFDGAQQGSSHQLDANSAKWDRGLIFLNQTRPCWVANGVLDNGTPCDATSSSNNPWYIAYFRAWQLQPVSSVGGFINLGVGHGPGTPIPTASPTPTPTPTPSPTPTPGPLAQAGTAVYHTTFTTNTSLAAADTTNGDRQFAMVTFNSASAYNGAPAGWTLACNVSNGTTNKSVSVYTRLNGASEPASNTWGPGPGGTVFKFMENGVTGGTGVDTSGAGGCTATSNSTSTNTVTIAAPATGSSDLTFNGANVSQTLTAGAMSITPSAGMTEWLPFSLTANGEVDGWYYSGTPSSVTITNTGTPGFQATGAQISFH